MNTPDPLTRLAALGERGRALQVRVADLIRQAQDAVPNTPVDLVRAEFDGAGTLLRLNFSGAASTAAVDELARAIDAAVVAGYATRPVVPPDADTVRAVLRRTAADGLPGPRTTAGRHGVRVHTVLGRIVRVTLDESGAERRSLNEIGRAVVDACTAALHTESLGDGGMTERST